MNNKRCPRCGETKDASSYYIIDKNTKPRLNTYCIPCCKELSNERAAKDRTVATAYAKKYRERTRQQVLDAYGNRCACCGETESLFLTVDHVNGDGAEHRRSLGNTDTKRNGLPLAVHRDIIKRGFPDDFQILCFNCNCGKERNGGVCPHELRKGLL